jgi:hypothetical protein
MYTFHKNGIRSVLVSMLSLSEVGRGCDPGQAKPDYKIVICWISTNI